MERVCKKRGAIICYEPDNFIEIRKNLNLTMVKCGKKHSNTLTMFLFEKIYYIIVLCLYSSVVERCTYVSDLGVQSPMEAY